MMGDRASVDTHLDQPMGFCDPCQPQEEHPKIKNSKTYASSMRRFPHDQFAKQYLAELLAPLGEVETSRDVPGKSGR